MRGVDKVYETFTQDVAAGRNLPIEKVLDIAAAACGRAAMPSGSG